MNGIARPWAATVAGVIGLIDGMVYLVLIHEQGHPSLVVPFVFAFISIASVGAFWGSIIWPAPRASVLLSCSTILFFALGVLGIFSIGLPLLLASALSLLAVFQSRLGDPESRSLRSSIGAAAAIAMILAAFFLTQLSGERDTASVTCGASAQGSGIPHLKGSKARSTAARPQPCVAPSSP